MPIEIIYTVKDARGKSSTTSVKVGTGETLARVQLFATAWADALDNLIQGVIRSAVAIRHLGASFLTGNVALDVSDVEEIGAVQMRTGSGILAEFNIPALDENATVDETGEFDETVTAVAALRAAIEDGIDVTGDTAYIVDVGGVSLEEVVYMRERSRNSGKRGNI